MKSVEVSQFRGFKAAALFRKIYTPLLPRKICPVKFPFAKPKFAR
jgi:hypothetical protein